VIQRSKREARSQVWLLPRRIAMSRIRLTTIGTMISPAAGASRAQWPDAAPLRDRQWPRRLGRTMTRVDVWLLIMAIITVVVTYLAWMKPH